MAMIVATEEHSGILITHWNNTNKDSTSTENRKDLSQANASPFFLFHAKTIQLQRLIDITTLLFIAIQNVEGLDYWALGVFTMDTAPVRRYETSINSSARSLALHSITMKQLQRLNDTYSLKYM